MELNDLYLVIVLLALGFVWMFVNMRAGDNWLKVLSLFLTTVFFITGSVFAVLALLDRV